MSKGPGKSHRKGLPLDRLFRMFPTDEAAAAWFAAERWPDGPSCPHCGSRNVQRGIKQGRGAAGDKLLQDED
ncbi:MAG: transposase [Defluviicoccus sp.]|nr:transposase [Defluviicoccus sp.]